MSRSYATAVGIASAVLLVSAVWVAGGAAPEAGSEGTERGPGGATVMSETGSQIAVEIACEQDRVEFTAPAGQRYDATVALVDARPESTDVSQTTAGSVEGNQTVSLGGNGIVYAFAQSHGERVATAVSDCTSNATNATNASNATNATDATNVTNATAESRDVEPSIRIDCAENRANFTAAEGTEYVAKVSVAAVSPAQTSTRSVSRTLAGNATVSFDQEGLVVAFASTGALGDDRTVSAMRDCGGSGENATLD